MIWSEMTYNSVLEKSILEVEPEELDEYYNKNMKTKEEYFNGFEQTNAFICN